MNDTRQKLKSSPHQPPQHSSNSSGEDKDKTTTGRGVVVVQKEGDYLTIGQQKRLV